MCLVLFPRIPYLFPLFPSFPFQASRSDRFLFLKPKSSWCDIITDGASFTDCGAALGSTMPGTLARLTVTGTGQTIGTTTTVFVWCWFVSVFGSFPQYSSKPELLGGNLVSVREGVQTCDRDGFILSENQTRQGVLVGSPKNHSAYPAKLR